MVPQTRDDLKELLKASRSATGNFVDALADFGVLLFLMSFPDIFDRQGFRAGGLRVGRSIGRCRSTAAAG